MKAEAEQLVFIPSTDRDGSVEGPFFVALTGHILYIPHCNTRLMSLDA